MAINKPSYCYPYGESINFAVPYESRNNITGTPCSGAQYIQCKVNTNNKRVTGYMLTLTDSDGNEIWSPKYITPISKLNQIDYGPRIGENHGDGTNGSTLIIPFIQSSAYIFSHTDEINGCANCLYSSIDHCVDYYLSNSSSSDWDTIINKAVVGATFLKCDVSDPDTPLWSIGVKKTDGSVDYSDGALGSGLYYIQIRLGNSGGQILRIQNREAGGETPTINPTNWLIYFDGYDSSAQRCNFTSVPVTLGQEYFWKIKLYQGEIQEKKFSFSDSTSYYLDGIEMPYDFDSKTVIVYYGEYSQIYDVNQYDILIGEGQIMGSTGERLQITPTNAILQKRWVQLGHSTQQYGIPFDWDPWGGRSRVETYDATFGHVYPALNSYPENILEQNPELNACCFYKHSNKVDDTEPKEVVKLATATMTVAEQAQLIYQIFVGGNSVWLDGVQPQNGDRVLIKDFKTIGSVNYSFLNGVYVVSTSSQWQRSGNYNNWGSLLNAILLVENGATNNSCNFESTTQPEGTLGRISSSGADAIRPYAAQAILTQYNDDWWYVNYQNGGWTRGARADTLVDDYYYLVVDLDDSQFGRTIQYGKFVSGTFNEPSIEIQKDDVLYSVRQRFFIYYDDTEGAEGWKELTGSEITNVFGDSINFIQEQPIILYDPNSRNWSEVADVSVNYINVSSDNIIQSFSNFDIDHQLYLKGDLRTDLLGQCLLNNGDTFFGQLNNELTWYTTTFNGVTYGTNENPWRIGIVGWDNLTRKYKYFSSYHETSVGSGIYCADTLTSYNNFSSDTYVPLIRLENSGGIATNQTISSGIYYKRNGVLRVGNEAGLSQLSNKYLKIRFNPEDDPSNYVNCVIISASETAIYFVILDDSDITTIQQNLKTYLGVFTVLDNGDTSGVTVARNWIKLQFEPLTSGVSINSTAAAEVKFLTSDYLGGVTVTGAVRQNVTGQLLHTEGYYPNNIIISEKNNYQTVALLNINNSETTYLKPDVNLESDQYIVFNEVNAVPRCINTIDKEIYGATFNNISSDIRYSSVTNSDTKEPYKYQIKSYFKASDYNPIRYGLTGDIGFNYVLYEGDSEYASYTIQDQDLTFILDNTVYSTDKTFLISYSPAADSYFQGFIRLEGYYRQTFGSNWSHYRMVLYDNDLNLVQDTGEIYSGDFIQKFYVPLDENSSIDYYCLLIVEDKNGEIYTCAAKITVPQSIALSSVQLSTTYNYDLQCINITASGVTSSNHYTLYRIEKNKTSYDIVDIFKPQEGNYTVHDFNITNNRQYKYMLQNIDSQTPITSSYVATSGRCWSIIELLPTDLSNYNNTSIKKKYIVDENNVWLFKYNGDFGSQTQNIAKSEQQTLGRYSRIGHGLKNNITGSVTALLGQDIILGTREDGKHGYYEKLRGSSISSNDPIDLLNLWRSFVVSNNPKLLKDVKGQKWIVQVMSGQNTPMLHVEGQPDTISFSWTEIEDTDNVIITNE